MIYDIHVPSLPLSSPPLRQVAQDPGNVTYRDLAAYRMTSGRPALAVGSINFVRSWPWWVFVTINTN